MSVFHVGLGVFIALVFALLLVYWYVRDITQKRHTVLRNYPIVGHLRFFFEHLGEYFRQYFFLGDREEMPFNCATRAWVYRLAKDEGGMLGFGSTYDIHQPGALLFVIAPFAVLEAERLAHAAAGHRRGYSGKPFVGRSLVNVSGMSLAPSPNRRWRFPRGSPGRVLDGYRRGRPVAPPPGRRLRRHLSDRHGQIRVRDGGAASIRCDSANWPPTTPSAPSRSKLSQGPSRARAASCRRPR